MHSIFLQYKHIMIVRKTLMNMHVHVHCTIMLAMLAMHGTQDSPHTSHFTSATSPSFSSIYFATFDTIP